MDSRTIIGQLDTMYGQLSERQRQVNNAIKNESEENIKKTKAMKKKAELYDKMIRIALDLIQMERAS